MPRAESGPAFADGAARREPTGRYTFGPDGHQLVLTIRGITAAQVTDLRGGEVELALVVDGREIVLCSRFGATIPWSHAAPYSWGGPRPRAMPITETGGCAQLRVSLVETADDRVRAWRDVRLTPAFTTALDAAIHEPAGAMLRVDSAARLYRLFHEPSRPGPRGAVGRPS